MVLDYNDLSYFALLSSANSKRHRYAFVPPETGRGILLERSDGTTPDVLIKGTGLVEKFTHSNKLRIGRAFNGYLELSEACRDYVNSRLLAAAGIRTAQPIAIIEHQQVFDFGEFEEWTCNYARGFVCQTRISNLQELQPSERKLAIDDAMTCLKQIGVNIHSYEQYFFYMLEELARVAAIYQAIGFTHDSLHNGQVTLACDIVDLGVGHFDKPERHGVINTIHPWFRYERQPLLFLNMLFRTHILKAEPQPIRLSKDQQDRKNQQCLFGFIQSFAPDAAERIALRQPEGFFWQRYKAYYDHMDGERFRRKAFEILPSFYNWEPSIDNITEHPRAYQSYQRRMIQINEFYETQQATWQRHGLLSMHKKLIWNDCLKVYARQHLSPVELNDPVPESDLTISMRETSTELNQKDLSFIPSDLEGKI